VDSDPSHKRDSDTTIATQSCSDAEEVEKKLFKREMKFRAPPRKKKVDEPTIEEMLHPVPRQLDALEIVPTAQSATSAREWLEDIELIRGRSSYQGVFSKRIRERVTAIKQVMKILTTRIESKRGDVEYLRRRNAELQAQLLVSQREIARMSRRLDELQRTTDELRKYMVTDGRIPKSDKATSPLEKAEDAVVMRPPIKGVSAPIPIQGNKNTVKQEDAEISRQIVELVARRKQLQR